MRKGGWKRWLLPLLWVCLAALPIMGERVRVATYNVENYTLANRMVDGIYRVDYPKPEVEKAALRSIIREVRPDVLAVQEMGPMPFLEELQRDLRREGLDFPYLALLTEADPVRKIGVLSRIPFVEVIPHNDLDFPYLDGREQVKRGLLEVRFETANIPWAFFTLHLKSKWTEHAEDPQANRRRVGEAHAIRDRIRHQFPEGEGGLFVVAGDFNDTRDTATLRRFLQVSDRTITEMLEAVDSRGERWTQHFARRDLYSRIDYLLVSPAMMPQVVPESARIVDSPNWRTASDHRMLYVDLDFGN